ncbi:MAG: hypothetical protein Q9167_005599 [Letrouitia subvulpina]
MAALQTTKKKEQDSLQAFTSSIAGLLSSRAVLEGVGVGDSSASPTAALLLSILQESTGRIATILFAHRLGTALEPECKMYRLAADIFNDAAMLLDCLSPALPRGPRVLLLSASSVLRALCGVAAGSAKASLSAHFAKWGNLGELNAKDSSQETVISLMGMLAGSVVVSYVSSPLATWSLLILLLSIHLAMNHSAVRAVSMRTLNRQRANIVLSTYLDDEKILTPKEVSARERIFEWDGAIRWKDSTPIARTEIGHSFHDLVRGLAPPHSITGSRRDVEAKLANLVGLYDGEDFLVQYSLVPRVALIILKEGAGSIAQLKAWALALWVAHRHHKTEGDYATGASSAEAILNLHRTTLDDLSHRWADCIERLAAAGWDLNADSLETGSGSRIRLETKTEQ